MMMESARECWSWVMSFCGERGDAMRNEANLVLMESGAPAHEPTVEDFAELHSFMANTAGAATQRPGEDTQHWLPSVGRADGGWCRTHFLKTVSGAGQESWKFFKATYKRSIDYSPDWQWVRVGQGQEINPFGAAKQD